MVIVDAGVPAYWGSIAVALAAMGRTFDDVRAVLLTHGHSDHTGFAERARRAGVGIRVHELDAARQSEVPDPPSAPTPCSSAMRSSPTR